MKYMTLAVVLVAAFFLNFAGASLTGLVKEAATPAGSAGFSAPQSVSSVLPAWAVSMFPVAILFLSTLLGIAVRVIWDPPGMSFWARFRKTTKALLLSPLVLYPSLGLAIHSPDPVVASLFAFQNGFFWESILRGRSFDPNPGVGLAPAAAAASNSAAPATQAPPAAPDMKGQ